jgi:hypothetical protein
MRNFRFTTNAASWPSPVVAQSRTYTVPVTTFVDVPEVDAPALSGNAWVQLLPVGPSSARPDSTQALYPHLRAYIDTDINKVVIFDGRAWRDPLTGSTV